MKRVEVKLALAVVAPLLDVIKELADGMGRQLAAPLAMPDLDDDFRATWVEELLAAQREEVGLLLALFDDQFFQDGVVAFDEGNAEIVLRACAAVRLWLREHHLKPIGDDMLEGGEVDLMALEEAVRRAFMCYLFLATLQELIIQHLDASILDG